MAVTESQLRRFVSFIPSASSVIDDLAAARAMMAQHLDAAGLSTALTHQIELRLAVHFAALRFMDARITSESIEGVSSLSYGGGDYDGYWLRAAIGLDPTGVLLSVGSERFYAEIHVGGLSKDVKYDALADPDRVQPAFRRNMDRYPDEPEWRR